ncbi:MAG: hypothetical protein EAZ32_14860 [Cytophagia bacterium]|nr:MAG: hypothetical protein EAZ46_10455 [Runella sp.]TAG37575.1 MAG: hypothetical protein EAZ32_14860 [Cytophagia bacterium]
MSYSQVVLQIKDVNDVFSSSVPPEQSISYYIYCIGASLEGCKVTWSGYKNSDIFPDGFVSPNENLLELQKWKNTNGNAKMKAKLKNCINTVVL